MKTFRTIPRPRLLTGAFRLALPLVLVAVGCAGGSEASAGAASASESQAGSGEQFTFRPELGREYLQTMRRVEEVQIVGAPMRHAEEWSVTFRMKIGRESNVFVYRAEIEKLSLTIDGADLLEGDEVKGKGGFMKLVFDESGRIVDVHHTETITAALVSIVDGSEGKEHIARMFSPEVLRGLFVARANERSLDLVGRPATVGATWGGEMVAADGSKPVAKELRVTGKKNCDGESCVRVEREIVIDRDTIWKGAEGRVKNYLSQQGQDSDALKLIDADVTLEDELVVNPNTMQYHGARFSQVAKMTVEGPAGQLTVKFSTLRESTYEF